MADAANRMEQLWREVLVNLATQAADLDIDDIGLRIKVVVPDRLEQHGPSNDLPLVPHEVFEKAKLARLKRNRLTRALRPSRPQVEPQIRDPQFATVLSRRAATKQRLETREQLGKRKGLSQIIVSAAAPPPNALV